MSECTFRLARIITKTVKNETKTYVPFMLFHKLNTCLYKKINDILPTLIEFEQFSLKVDKSSASIYKQEDNILFSQNKIFDVYGLLFNTYLMFIFFL